MFVLQGASADSVLIGTPGARGPPGVTGQKGEPGAAGPLGPKGDRVRFTCSTDNAITCHCHVFLYTNELLLMCLTGFDGTSGR